MANTWMNKKKLHNPFSAIKEGEGLLWAPKGKSPSLPALRGV
jgi:hypothetical protein